MVSGSQRSKPHNLVYIHRDQGYRFSVRDPDLEWMADAIDKSGLSVGDIVEAVLDVSNNSVHVSYSTIHNWLNGKTRRPQNFTLTWVALALGTELGQGIQSEGGSVVMAWPGKPRRPRQGDEEWCSRGQHYVATSDFYEKRAAPLMKDGTVATMSWCKGCLKEYSRKQHDKRPRKFDAVVTPDGRIGMVVHTNYTIVQFGAGGPFEHHRSSALRWATQQEVRDAGMEGVGGLVVRVER